MEKIMLPSTLRRKIPGILFALVIAGAACTTVPPSAASSPSVLPPATEAAAATVTLPPEASATVTPQPSSTPTLTGTPTPSPTLSASLPPVSLPLPSLTPTAEPPHVTVLEDAPCNFGPGTDYDRKYPLFALNWMRAVGRNPDGTWLNIKSLDDPLWKACWIQTDKVRFDNGSLRDVPIVSMTTFFSRLYQPPAVVGAARSGNVVTISWQPVYMTEDDARGYLVEAWVCQGGKQVFVPTGMWVSYSRNQNAAELSLQVTDEPGCDVPSNARLYAVEKHGYTGYRPIPWPGFEPASAAVETPASAGTAPAPGGLPLASLRQYSDCLYGPGDFFLYKTSFPAGTWMEVIGRSPDGAWLAVQEVNGWDPCWIPVTKASFPSGSLDGVPVSYPTLPVSYWYKPPIVLPVRRSGNAVTVAWNAVGMAEYDYRGYLIIAWVCQGGQQVYLPVNVAPPYAENTGVLSVTIQDEPGCKEASSASIYIAEKRGYFGEKIFWPAY